MNFPSNIPELKLTDFKIFDKVLGIGAFGSVHLAKHLKSNAIFALKIINLAKLEGPIEHEFARKEVVFHSKANHKHIIKFHGIMKNNDTLYHVLEFAENGNLYKMMKKKPKMSESQVFRFFYQTLLALKYLHENGIMHRDIKPENLLLDKNNCIKLCDFGWCDSPINQYKKHFCGTYEYMAPEIVERRPHNYKVDIWSLGVLLYELFYGFTPFRSKIEGDKKGIMENIRKADLRFDEPINEDLKDLIQNMVLKNSDRRLEIKEIIAHKWVQNKLSALTIKVSSCEKSNENVNVTIHKKQESPQLRVNKCIKSQEIKQKHKDPPLKSKTINILAVNKPNIKDKKNNIFDRKNTLDSFPYGMNEINSILSKPPMSATKHKSFLLMSNNSELRIFTEELEHEENDKKEKEFQRNMMESMRGFDMVLRERKKSDLSTVSELSTVEVSDEGTPNKINLFVKNNMNDELILKCS